VASEVAWKMMGRSVSGLTDSFYAKAGRPALRNPSANRRRFVFHKGAIMPRTYEAAGQEVWSVHNLLVARYYHWIDKEGVTFNLLIAHGPVDKDGNTTAPAIMLHGHRAAATVKINSLKDRVKGLHDVTIEIDGDLWPKWSNEQRRSVLDHELYHLEPHTNADGSPKLDDCGRPYLTLRKHDFHFGGFAEIAARHRDHAFEVKAVEEAYALCAGAGGQLEWPWAAPRPSRKLQVS